MALTITLEGTGIIAYCDALSDTAGGTWSEVGGGSIEATTDAFLCGSSCIGGGYSNKSGLQQYALSSALDFDTAGNEEGQLLYIWLQTSTIYLHETIANEGLKVRLATTTTDYREYIIAAGDNTNGWTGDWKCFVIDPTLAGSVNDTGSYDYGNINYIGIWLDITALAKGNNILIDMITCCSGLRVTGTSTTPWDDIVSYCNDFTTRAWGIVQQREGVIYVYGKIYFGDSTQSAAASFTETSAPVIKFGISEYYYSGGWVISHPSDYSGIIVEDASSYTTTFDDGIIVGSDNGRSGTSFLGHSDIDVSVDLYGGNHADSLTRLYGTAFRDLLGGINWGDDANHLFYGGTVAGCGQFDPVGSVKLRNVIFSSTEDSWGGTNPDGSSLLWNPSIDIEDCKFIANTDDTYDPHAIEHPNSGEYNYQDLVFSGNDYDVHFTASGELVINNLGTSNASSAHVQVGDSASFLTSKSHTLTGLQDNSEITYVSGEGLSGIVLYHNDAPLSGETTYIYNYQGDFYVDILISHLSYENIVLENILLSDSDQTLPITQITDRIYYNP